MTHALTVPMQAPDPIPASWYTVGVSQDLPTGGMRAVTVAGIDLLVYRTTDGRLCCVQDRCPHLGGRFSAGGTVEQNELICPVHQFRFAPDGSCRGSGYGTPAPKACTRPWPCLDRNGLLLAFYHPAGAAPAWQPPELDASGWRAMTMFTRTVTAPAGVVMQGIADMGHLQTLHGYEDVHMDSEFHTDAQQLSVSYSFTNVGSLPGLGKLVEKLGRAWQTRTRVCFDYLACGIGYSVTEVRLPELDIAMRHFVNPTPQDANSVTLYHSIALRRIHDPARISPALAYLPQRWTEALMHHVLCKGFLHDIEDDVQLWTHMRNPAQPALARGDGPIHKYHRWSRQFYLSATAQRLG